MSGRWPVATEIMESRINFDAMLQAQRLSHLEELLLSLWRCQNSTATGQALPTGSCGSVGIKTQPHCDGYRRRGLLGRTGRCAKLAARILGIYLSCVYEGFFNSQSNSVLVQRSEASRRVSSGKDEECDFQKSENQRIVDEGRMAWILGWERSRDRRDNRYRATDWLTFWNMKMLR